MRRLALVVCVGCSDPAASPDAGVDALPDAAAASIQITPSTYDFGDHELAIAHGFPVLTFSVKNVSADAVEITAIATAGTHAMDFGITRNQCPTTLASGDSCNVTVQFEPNGPQFRDAKLEVSTPADVATASLLGKGIVVGQKVVVVPAVRDFGDIPVSDVSTHVFTVFNETAGPSILTPSLVGDAQRFVFDSDCTGLIPVHGSCAVSVAFVPDYLGEVRSILKVTAATGSGGAGLIGHSSSPFVIAPYGGPVGSMLVGQPEPGPARTFTVSNTTDIVTGPTTGTLTPSITGGDAGDYTIDSTTCTTLAPQQSCTVTVRLVATTRGSKEADLVVTDSTSSLAAHASVTGSGYTVFISTPGTFTATTSGQTTTKTLNVLNSSDRATGGITLGIVGSQFAIISQTCASGLAAHESCTVQVAFSPTSAGAKTATLQASASPGGSHSITLSGTGL